MTQWTITHEADWMKSERKSIVGITGPSTATMTPRDICRHPQRVQWRAYDDDGIFYCGGFMVGDSNEFAPLDNFCSPSLGCTYLKVKNVKTGLFETL